MEPSTPDTTFLKRQKKERSLGYSSKNYVRKFLRALHPKWRAKVTSIEESKDLTSLSLGELIGNFKVHEMIIKKDSEIVKAKVERKSIALKAKNLVMKSVRLSVVKTKSTPWRTFQRSRDDKNSKSDRKCFRCSYPNRLIGECPKPPKDKNQRDFVGGSWSDSGEEDDEKVKDETCLVAHASSEIKDRGCSKHMTGNRKLFSTYKVYNRGNVIFDSNLRDNIIGKGKQAYACHKAKNVVSTNRCLELLHMYLFGPSVVWSYGGNRYTLVIVDDYSRDDDLDEEEAIKVIEKKNLENNIVDETLEIDEIVNIKESRNLPLENVIGNLNERTLRSQAQNKSNFFCFISTIEPKNVNEALGDESWIVAMQEELNQFIANDVWEFVPQPKNMTIIGTKWVFRNKLDENGSTCQDICDEFAKIMHDEFTMSMMGELNFFLGLQIKQMEDGIFFNQSKYIKEMLKKFGREDYKPMKTPISFDAKLTKDKELYAFVPASKKLPKPLTLKQLSVSFDTFKALRT
nr:alpha/beta hydrolases superfamily protein [Tanacetum cinerariifolium]